MARAQGEVADEAALAELLDGAVPAEPEGGFSRSTLCLPVFGAAPKGLRLERMQGSPNFAGGRARNLVETPMTRPGEMAPVMWDYVAGREQRTPSEVLPVVRPDVAALAPTSGALRVTWMGHSTMLLEVDGHLLLTDPVFCERASPFQWMGPRRFHPTPLRIEELPPLDGVLLSHDHYDHLDYAAIQALAKRGERFFVPLGVGAHLESWGVNPASITELDWWEEARLGELRLVAAPARHFSGRGPGDRDATLWASWAIIGPRHRAWFSGDTGPFEAATEIGLKLGPFDLTMIESGAFHPAWGNIHLGPDEAAKLHLQVRGRVMMPVHWGTFRLALHAWDQPIVRLQQRAVELGIALHSPLAGEISRADEPMVARLWRERAGIL